MLKKYHFVIFFLSNLFFQTVKSEVTTPDYTKIDKTFISNANKNELYDKELYFAHGKSNARKLLETYDFIIRDAFQRENCDLTNIEKNFKIPANHKAAYIVSAINPLSFLLVFGLMEGLPGQKGLIRDLRLKITGSCPHPFDFFIGKDMDLKRARDPNGPLHAITLTFKTPQGKTIHHYRYLEKELAAVEEAKGEKKALHSAYSGNYHYERDYHSEYGGGTYEKQRIYYAYGKTMAKSHLQTYDEILHDAFQREGCNLINVEKSYNVPTGEKIILFTGIGALINLIGAAAEPGRLKGMIRNLHMKIIAECPNPFVLYFDRDLESKQLRDPNGPKIGVSLIFGDTLGKYHHAYRYVGTEYVGMIDYDEEERQKNGKVGEPPLPASKVEQKTFGFR